ncbi:uncharacterized protein LOC114246933 [Bombyx mandarina]|uniref:Uncharacterized protein LOC114246933 n=1 Tax=Bombyx mandarina TaxID=7092 RepID=A0A6J2K0U2_BOMMA|nr:uncharacterized protein LOC114246933 [Bombyx mandarina]
MEMPEVNRCFGMFPPKYGCLLISWLGLATGGTGLAGIIMYGIVQEQIIAHFMNTTKVDEGSKKMALMSIGFTSLMLFIGNGLLFLGVTFSSKSCVKYFVYVTFAMCLIMIMGCIGAPVSCFFLAKTCVMKKISSPAMVIGYLGFTIFIELWLYFMVVGYNFKESL